MKENSQPQTETNVDSETSTSKILHQILATVAEIKNTNTNLTSKFDTLSHGVAATNLKVDTLSHGVDATNLKVDTLSLGVAAITLEVADIKNNFANIENWCKSKDPLFKKLELSLDRAFLLDRKGPDFVKPLTINCLYDLATIVMPPDRPLDFEIQSNEFVNKRPSALINLRVGKLSSVARNHINPLKQWAMSTLALNDRKKSGKASKIINPLARYENLTNVLDKEEFLLLDALGFQAFSREAFTDPDAIPGYLQELQFDMKGSVIMAGNFLSIEVGEIKSSERQKAIDQILVRCSVMYAAIRIILTPEKVHTFIIHFNGLMITDSSWLPPEIEEAAERIKVLKLSLPPELVSLSLVTIE